ncbi:MAG: hybrid sensor histidine kinase/response regulator [Verrucomicrobiota bacterium]
MISILVIEDNPADIRLIEEHLISISHEFDYQLSSVESLGEALDHLAKSPVDIILTDLNLPDSEGSESVNELISRFPEIPTVVLSGLADEEQAVKLVGAGAQDYLRKDEISGSTLRRTIRHSLERFAIASRLREVSLDLEKQNLDLVQSQRRLIRAEKMRTIGHLASGLAHEVKNPLAIIQLGLDKLEGQIARGYEPIKPETLDRMQTALQRADQVIGELLSFGSELDGHIATCHLSDAIDSAIALVGPKLKANEIELDRIVSEDPPIRIDRNKVEQAIINLILNSINELGEIPVDGFIRVQMLVQKEADTQWANILVEDNGRGIPDEDLSKVTEAFVTNRADCGGTGLGLTVVSQIASLHHGDLTLSRSDLGGLKAALSIPLAV